MKRLVKSSIFCTTCSFFIIYGLTNSDVRQQVHICRTGYFHEDGGNCKKMLNCNDMNSDLQILKELPGGFVKQMFLVNWRSMNLVYSVPRGGLYTEDFEHGLKMMEGFQGIRYFPQLVGFCYSPLQILTKYYKNGSANNLQSIISGHGLSELQEAKIRLQLALDYLEIIDFLHDSPIGCRVMCDSNNLNKTMSQFLISDDFHLILADIDALPEVQKRSNKLVKCGHRQLFGTFVAPEQLWQDENKIFDDNKMPGYDEKTDIWKIPDVIFYLLGNTTIGDHIKFMLFDKFKQCKAAIPSQRPNAKEILSKFILIKDKILEELGSSRIDDEL